MMIAPFSWLLRRLRNVLSYHSFTDRRRVSERASSAFSGSSMIMISAPRPVSTPPIEVESRNPPSFVSNSKTASRSPDIRVSNSASLRFDFGQFRLPPTPIQQLIFDGHCLIGKRWKYSAASFLAAVRSLGELLADEASQPGGMVPRSHRPARDIIPPLGERGR